jgi:phosphoglucomutase
MKLQFKHLPLVAFLLFFIKSLVLGISWQDVAFGLVVGAVAYLYERVSNDQQLKQIADLVKQSENSVKALEQKLEQRLDAQDVVINENRSYISGMKLQRNGGSNGLGR